MTKAFLTELQPVLQAITEGKTIQYNVNPASSTSDWFDLHMSSNFDLDSLFTPSYSYRVKPEHKFIPFSYADRTLLLGQVICPVSKNESSSIIVSCNKTGVRLGSGSFELYAELAERCVFTSGAPLGRFEEPETVVSEAKFTDMVGDDLPF